MQLDLFPDSVGKHLNGHTWHVGSYHMRNKNGYLQTREEGAKNWLFVVPWFANDDKTCTVYKIDNFGELFHENQILIDLKNRISIMDKKYGPAFWTH